MAWSEVASNSLLQYQVRPSTTPSCWVGSWNLNYKLCFTSMEIDKKLVRWYILRLQTNLIYHLSVPRRLESSSMDQAVVSIGSFLCFLSSFCSTGVYYKKYLLILPTSWIFLSEKVKSGTAGNDSEGCKSRFESTFLDLNWNCHLPSTNCNILMCW